jgi:hypothetical protein
VAAAEDVTVIVRQDPRDCAHYDSLPSSACTAFDFDGDGKSDGVDVVFYTLRAEVTTAEVTLRYQTASKEYVDFLSNPANTGDYTDRFTLGLKAAWMLTGMSPPVDMSPTVVATLTP